MGDKNTYEDEWMEEAPLLSSLRDSLPDEAAPEGYFGELPARVMDRIRALDTEPGGDTPPVKLPARRLNRRVWWGLAASVLLLAVAGWYFLSPREMSDQAFEAHIQSRLTTVSDEQLMKELEMSGISGQELYEVLGQEAQAALEEEMGGMEQENLLDYLDGLELNDLDWEGMELDPDMLDDVIL